MSFPFYFLFIQNVSSVTWDWAVSVSPQKELAPPTGPSIHASPLGPPLGDSSSPST